MSAKLWFLNELEDVMSENKDKFATGKNSWYNLLFTSVHIFFAGKYLEREEILQEMQAIYEEEKPGKNHIGFNLPSKKQKDGSLEFGLLDPENVEKIRPIRERNDKLNEQLFILQDFMGFLYSIDPRSEIFEEQYLPQLEALFEEWWEKQMTLRKEALKAVEAESKKEKKEKKEAEPFNEKGEVPDSQRSDV